MDYELMTIKQLRKLIRDDQSLTVQGYTRMTKDELIKALVWADEAEQRVWAD